VATGTFRARAGAAPLKHDFINGAIAADFAFRARAGAAPLKRIQSWRRESIPKVHSAPARARPR